MQPIARSILRTAAARSRVALLRNLSGIAGGGCKPAGGGCKPAGPVNLRVPPGDDKQRLVCDDCGFINYKNPLLVVGCIVTDRTGRILLCRRAIQPRKGFWGIPCGFMECGEDLETGATREVFEEADAKVAPGRLVALYSVPKISQVHAYYHATLDEAHAATTPTARVPAGAAAAPPSFVPPVPTGSFGSGVETLESRLFTVDEIPWAQLAFPTFRDALQAYVRHVKAGGDPAAIPTHHKTMVEMPPAPDAPLPLPAAMA